MADEKKQKDQQRVEAGAKATVKLEAVRAVKAISNNDSNWSLTQEIFQEVQAGYIVSNPDVQPKTTDMTKDLISEIEKRYVDDPQLKKLLLDSVPAVRSVREWLKKDGWEEAVWNKVRGDRLFSPDRRAQVIESLRVRAIEKSDTAAKIWLTLSGDYSDKLDVTDSSANMFREINKVLHKKNNED